MIIKDENTICEIQEQGDKLIFNHMAYVDPVRKAAHEVREWSDNGWTKDRHMRQIAFIPPLTVEWLKANRPDVLKDGKAMKKWLMTEEGKQWLTVKAIDTGRSGKTIIK